MSDSQQGPGWWLASDGKWYPPQSHPGYQQTYPPPPIPPGPGMPYAPVPPPQSGNLPPWLVPSHVSGWAVAAGYLGLVTFILCGLPGPFAVFTGVKGLRQIKRQPGLNGTVRAWVGIVLGGLGCVLLALILIAVIAGQFADADASR